MASIEEQIDKLYGLPLEEFTAARDGLAKSLRAEGSRSAADEVKRLRKPNLVGWALNQVRNQHPDRVSELLAAGQRLQDAQRQLVSGGERGLLRSAVSEERKLIEEVVSLAERQLAAAGHNAAAALQGKLWATAHAAAAGSEAAELLRSGRLLRDYEVSDLGLSAVAATTRPAAVKEPARRTGAHADEGRKHQADAERAERKREADAERKRRSLTGQLERAGARAKELRQKLQDAEREAAQAGSEAARAASMSERAQARAEQARDRFSAASERVDELERSLRTLRTLD